MITAALACKTDKVRLLCLAGAIQGAGTTGLRGSETLWIAARAPFELFKPMSPSCLRLPRLGAVVRAEAEHLWNEPPGAGPGPAPGARPGHGRWLTPG